MVPFHSCFTEKLNLGLGKFKRQPIKLCIYIHTYDEKRKWWQICLFFSM